MNDRIAFISISLLMVINATINLIVPYCMYQSGLHAQGGS